MVEIKKMDIKKFVELGYLQEINRQFLHLLGLALEVEIKDDGEYMLSGIWDYRDSPWGMRFGNDIISDKMTLKKAKYVIEQFRNKMSERARECGWVVQPIDGLDIQEFFIYKGVK